MNVKFEGLDPFIRRKFNEKLKYFNPTSRYSSSFKLGHWDGKIVFGTIGGATYINLLDRVLPMIMQEYEIDIEDRRPDYNFSFDHIDNNYVSEFTWPEGHRLAGEPIVLADHQVNAVNDFLDNQQSLQQLATGFGKSTTCGCMSKVIEKYGKSLIIVPNKSLITQTEADYKLLGLKVGVYYGDEKRIDDCNHVIATWQSLSRVNEKDHPEMFKFLKNLVCVICDEVHAAKAKELRELLCGTLAYVPIRWGLTGTIPKEEYEYVSLIASLGPVVGDVRAKELQDKGFLANCKIEIVQVQDTHEEFYEYKDENDYLTTDPKRLEALSKLFIEISKTGNTLILVDRIATGKALMKLIPDSVFVSGSMSGKKRKKEYDEIQIADNSVLIATSGVAAVGINIPRIFNLILFQSGKSFVRTIQSIGRILRLAKDKTHANIFDVCSDMKYSKRHLTKRLSFYKEAGHPYTISKLEL